MPLDATPRMKEDKLLTVMQRARALIDQPWKWLKGSVHDVIIRDRKQVDRFCAYGAINAANAGVGCHVGFAREVRSYMEYALQQHKKLLDTPSLVHFNDATTHEKVLSAFDISITKRERELTEEAWAESKT